MRRPGPFEITEPARAALTHWSDMLRSRSDDWLFPSRIRAGAHINILEYTGLVDGWVQMIDLNPGT